MNDWPAEAVARAKPALYVVNYRSGQREHKTPTGLRSIEEGKGRADDD
ncbi:hypothetical protein [Tropicimonas isoalkanivorans]|uniref:Uncharacterized protein n=1 Tax=Tropicimonas isoalkanivorans TaxID=441112 RepID=A0A1I1NI76_9RHOB|nr:hypothetical protein [Tropicimonas isoalkanivorans]SFC93440.1 hypothetical protein SAMN04488094_111170 [Tropicimonas isoalkanivorans]